MKNILISILMVFTLSACFSSNKAFDDDGFTSWMDQLNSRIVANHNYKRIPLDQDGQFEAYVDLVYKAYKKEIDKNTFIQTLNNMYPGYQTSVNFIAKQL